MARKTKKQRKKNGVSGKTENYDASGTTGVSSTDGNHGSSGRGGMSPDFKPQTAKKSKPKK